MLGKALVVGAVLHSAGALSDAGAQDNSWLIVVAVTLVVVGIAAFFLGRRKKGDADS